MLRTPAAKELVVSPVLYSLIYTVGAGASLLTTLEAVLLYDPPAQHFELAVYWGGLSLCSGVGVMLAYLAIEAWTHGRRLRGQHDAEPEQFSRRPRNRANRRE